MKSKIQNSPTYHESKGTFFGKDKKQFYTDTILWHIWQCKKQSKQFHDLQILRGFCYKEND